MSQDHTWFGPVAGERFLYALRHADYSWHLMLAGPGTAPRELAAIASS